jgi:hypothetical protein
VIIDPGGGEAKGVYGVPGPFGFWDRVGNGTAWQCRVDGLLHYFLLFIELLSVAKRLHLDGSIGCIWDLLLT